ncbi:DUF4153 domain-containing protein [Methylobacillus arboreus]|uniref:DUF4153 domain-containing protein n=1 Tax=Methylobacillus arboreus TaxID=755170 RepID=UPI001E45A753|nr:DUF4153 domain-containing protein [Methylobacillus arboreus]MCB5191378.1 DUF4153 domain-containing protein [Methylobacillus arboreus]
MNRQERSWIIAWATLQGVGLWLLHEWLLRLAAPGQYFSLIWPLYVLILTLPLSQMVLSGYRQQKRLWWMASGFSLLMAGAAAYVGHQAWVADLPFSKTGELGFTLGVITAASWFVLLPFAEHRLRLNSWFSDYSLLFSAAWRNLVKLLLAAVFAGLFWALLFLLAGLFKVLNVNFLMGLFTSRIFAYPVTAIAFGIGLSLYAAKEEALVGIYRASLNILGWLLPVVSFILILFLLALPFQGLALLWKTGYATSLMLCLLAWTVFLFNAAWQDASGEQRFPKWLLRFIGVGLLAMPVYTGLCAYSLALRVAQYGWTIDRIWAALAIMTMAIYALGYAFVVIRRQAIWMAGARQVNIAAALFTVALLILTVTPVLDPARIAVGSQVARLMDGLTPVSDFDFEYLRLQGGRYGNQVLQDLSKNNDHANADLVRQKAEAALRVKYRTFHDKGRGLLTREQLSGHLAPYPHGVELDAEFVDLLLEQRNAGSIYLNCSAKKPCPVLSVDLNADGENELVLLDGYQSRIFSLDNGKWRVAGRLQGQRSNWLTQKDVTGALDQLGFSIKPSQWQDLWIGDMKYEVLEE